MSQIFDEEGNAIPVTLVQAGPIVVTQTKTNEKDGYSALQVGFGQKSKNKMKKPQAGHLKKHAGKENLRWMREVHTEEEMKPGDTIDVSVFTEGEKVEVSGISKGKGFQGVVKRHGFHGGPRSHGQKHSEREPGSIGTGGVQRVIKGLRMAGRMGSDRVTLKSVRVVKVDAKNNIIALKGALPGAWGTLLEIKGKEASVKK